MDQAKFKEIVSGRRRGVWPAAMRALLCVPGAAYSAVMGARRWAYSHGLLPSRRAGLPVVCVGNITVGGTGKTPMVAWVVSRLREMGKRPAVLTRGYGRGAAAGDEARLLAELCGVPVVVNADRVAGAEAALAGGADVAVMDDGFQHRRLARDLDIVLVDATNPLGYGHVLPRGLLREPARALADAGVIVITRSDALVAQELGDLRAKLRAIAGDKPMAAAVHRPAAVVDGAGKRLPLTALMGARVMAFCGIGNPEAFFRAAEKLGAQVRGRQTLDDHAPYSRELLAELSSAAKGCKADVLLTTQKDHVKLRDFPADMPVWQLAVEMEIIQGEDALSGALRQALGK